jgi:lactam utilization protein B
MAKPITLQRQHERMAAALRSIAAKARAFHGDTDEREQNDMEDAFSNGIDVGTHEALKDCAAVARKALRGVTTAPTSTVDDLIAALKALRQNVDRDLSGYWTESTSNVMQQADAALRKAGVR